MLALEGLSYDRPYSDARGAMSPLAGYAMSLPASEVTLFAGASAAVELLSQAEIYVVMSSSASIAGLFTLETAIGAVIASSATASIAMSTQQTIEVLLASFAQANNLSFEDAADLTVWVLNTKTGATTRYDNYPFNSFTKIGGKHYGAKDDGIYELTGVDDAGAVIDAAVNLGKNNFGTSLLKSMDNCYVGAASDGKIIVKVTVNGVTYSYSARNSSTELEVQRVDMGRGLRANYYELEIQNTAGGAFELASVEFTPVPLSRRI